MQSEVVQQEFASLLGDLQRLSLIGNKFPEFDVEGKKMFLDQMETGIDKFQIFIKRLELAKDDANAQEFLRYSNAQMLNAGFTLNQFVGKLSSGLHEHRRWAEEEEKVIGDPEKHQQFKAVMRSVWGGAPMGRLDMSGVYDNLNKLDPRVVMKAHSDPQFWVALTDITQNPSTAAKWMDHPNIGPLACELWRAMQSSSWNQK